MGKTKQTPRKATPPPADPRTAAIAPAVALLATLAPATTKSRGRTLLGLARAAGVLVLRLREAPYAARLGRLPPHLWPPKLLTNLEILEKAGVALSEGSPEAVGQAVTNARQEAIALRRKLRRALPRCFDPDDPTLRELGPMSGRSSSQLTEDLDRLRAAFRGNESAWKPFPRLVSSADLERVPAIKKAIESARDPERELRDQVYTQLADHFRRARRAGLAVLAEGEEAPALPTLSPPKKPKKGGKSADDENTKGKKAKDQEAKDGGGKEKKLRGDTKGESATSKGKGPSDEAKGTDEAKNAADARAGSAPGAAAAEVKPVGGERPPAAGDEAGTRTAASSPPASPPAAAAGDA